MCFWADSFNCSDNGVVPVTWIGLFEITMRRLQNAWMDLYRDPQSVEFTHNNAKRSQQWMQKTDPTLYSRFGIREQKQPDNNIKPISITWEFDCRDVHCAGRFE